MACFGDGSYQDLVEHADTPKHNEARAVCLSSACNQHSSLLIDVPKSSMGAMHRYKRHEHSFMGFDGTNTRT